MKVKTSEYSTPWDPNEEDQVTSKHSTAIAIEQLQRDFLRLLELFSDKKLSEGVNINLRVGYPLVTRPTSDQFILTKLDFDRPGDQLLARLGLKDTSESDLAIFSSQEIDRRRKIFRSIVARYIGLLSCVPMKNPSQALIHGTERIRRETVEVDEAFRAITTSEVNEAHHEDQM